MCAKGSSFNKIHSCFLFIWFVCLLVVLIAKCFILQPENLCMHCSDHAQLHTKSGSFGMSYFSFVNKRLCQYGVACTFSALLLWFSVFALELILPVFLTIFSILSSNTCKFLFENIKARIFWKIHKKAFFLFSKSLQVLNSLTFFLLVEKYFPVIV